MFSKAGGHYLGRILGGLDVNSHNFEALPPHFIEGMETGDDVKQALQLSCFRNILDIDEKTNETNMTSILLRP